MKFIKYFLQRFTLFIKFYITIIYFLTAVESSKWAIAKIHHIDIYLLLNRGKLSPMAEALEHSPEGTIVRWGKTRSAHKKLTISASLPSSLGAVESITRSFPYHSTTNSLAKIICFNYWLIDCNYCHLWSNMVFFIKRIIYIKKIIRHRSVKSLM